MVRILTVVAIFCDPVLAISVGIRMQGASQ